MTETITGDGYDPEVTDGALIARIFAEPPFADDPVIVDNVDGQDMMGDPSVAVDPFDPANLIVASLHGGVSGGGAAGTCT